MSKFFLNRPVLAGVCAIIILLAGFAAFLVLPVAQYPEIAPPTIQINATYPGANAETVARAVAAPIEAQLSGIEGLQFFNSNSSSSGSLSISATFDVGTNVDLATFNVNNRVQLALPRLPDEVRRNGVTVQKRSGDLLMFMALTSPDQSLSVFEMSNYATLNVVDEIKRVPGIADINVFGAREYSMRVWLQPDKMSQLGVTIGDVTEALRAQNAQYAAGAVGGEPAPPGQQLSFAVTARGRLVEPEEFGDIIVRAGGPAGVLRLRDIARVELGAQNYSVVTMLEGKPMIGMGVFLQPGANALTVVDAVKARMDELKRGFPPGLDYRIPVDSTDFVKASIREVVMTISEAALLVIAVVFLFLQSWRATIIPFVAVPVSLIGAFAGLWLFGFSINTLTLFAMVLAIGIVVDDAIVVLENVERLMREQSMNAYDAAVEAMREVSGAIIAIVLVLCAVFVPVAFLGGMAGQLYRQFAVTVAIAVIISGFTALTLTPVMCAMLLRPGRHEAAFLRRFNVGFEWLTEKFLRYVQLALARRKQAFAVFGGVVVLGAILLYVVPRGFLPTEDQGQVLVSVQLPDGATLERTLAVTTQLHDELQKNPVFHNMTAINGSDFVGGGANAGSATMFVRLIDWSKRSITSDDAAGIVLRTARGVREGNVRAFNPPPIRSLGQVGGVEFYLQSRTEASAQQLLGVTQEFIEQLGKHAKLANANTFFRATMPQLRVEVDREKALALGAPIEQIFNALQGTIGSLYVNDFNKFGRTYRVQLQADAPYRAKPDDLGNVYVRSTKSGQMIPLKAVMTVEHIVGPDSLDRFNGFDAVRVVANAKPGVSSGEAIDAINEVAAGALPDGYELAWSGQAFQEQRAGSASAFAFAAGIVMVFLILAALYERWRLPIAVVLTVPFAVVGALMFSGMRGMANDIYFQIGLVVLIGLAAKNAILIVEFAQQGFLAGKSPMEAAVDAARLRFRPIVMTSLAFMFGVAPLAISTGAGSAARQSMGTGVFGGMLASTFIATVFVPLFFTVVSLRRRDRRAD